MSKVQQHSVSQATTFAMWGAVAALKGDQRCVEEMRTEFDKRRKYIIEELGHMGYICAPADGAFYAFVKVTGDDMEIATDWLEKAHVAATPGTRSMRPAGSGSCMRPRWTGSKKRWVGSEELAGTNLPALSHIFITRFTTLSLRFPQGTGQ